MYRNDALRVVTPKRRAAWASGSGGRHDYAFFNGKRMEIQADGIELTMRPPRRPTVAAPYIQDPGVLVEPGKQVPGRVLRRAPGADRSTSPSAHP